MAESKLQITINAINNASAELKTLAKDLGVLDEKSKKTSKSTTGLKTDLLNLYAGFQLAKEGAQLVYQALEQVYKSAREGAEIQYTEDKFNRLAKSIGTTSEALERDLAGAMDGMISRYDMLQGANELMALGLVKSHDEAVRLSNVSAQLGMNMNQLVLTLTNQTTMRFDALGVSVDGFKERVKELEDAGMSASDAFQEAFLRQAEDQLKRVGSAADSSIGAYKKFEAAVSDLGDAFKEDLGEKALPVVKALTEFFRESADAKTVQEDLTKALKEGSISLDDYNRALTIIKYSGTENAEVQRILELALRDTGDAATDSASKMRHYSSVASDSLSTLTETTDVFKYSMKEINEFVRGEWGKTLDNYNDKLGDLQTEHQALTIELQNLLAEGLDPTSSEVQKLTDKIDDNEEAQRDLKSSLDDTTTALLYQQLAASADAETAYNLAVQFGLVDEKTKLVHDAIDILTDKYDINKDGAISAAEATAGYWADVDHLKRSMDLLEDKTVTITTIMNTVYTSSGQPVSAEKPIKTSPFTPFGPPAPAKPALPAKPGVSVVPKKLAAGTDGWQIVPPGFPNDTFPIHLSSGEAFNVVPNGKRGGAGSTNYFYGPVTLQISQEGADRMISDMVMV